ncbi:Hypothetical predicted protein [Olea europaea subsp. europaea]|uniref:Uncharacterized protein n=1 Tax=Olea europaea subsp. europaea TaxID=158383 RepID=A0A8S0TFW4_OLEEU|nr:Hypothetical predicted protein [Olea europaea subsp. europaea]
MHGDSGWHQWHTPAPYGTSGTLRPPMAPRGTRWHLATPQAIHVGDLLCVYPCGSRRYERCVVRYRLGISTPLSRRNSPRVGSAHEHTAPHYFQPVGSNALIVSNSGWKARDCVSHGGAPAV